MNRDLRLLIGGSAVSFAGDALAVVALTLRLKPHGSAWVGALLAAELLPSAVLAPLTGRLVDRVETRRLLIVLMSLQALVAVPLAFARDPWVVVGLFAVLGSVAACVMPAGSALVPVVAGPEDAPRAYRMMSTAVAFGYLVGPAIGGVLVPLIGSTATVLVDAASFAVLALSRAAMTVRRVPEPRDPTVSRGPNPVWADRALGLAVVTMAFAFLCATVDNVAAPFRFVDELHGSARTFGAYVTIWSLGALVGAPLTGKLGPPLRALALGTIVIGAGIVGMGLAPSTGVALVAALGGGFGNGVLNASQGAVVSTHVDESEHGRAFATVGGVFSAGLLLGTLVGPVVVDALGAGDAMVVSGALTCAVALPLRLRPATRVPA